MAKGRGYIAQNIIKLQEHNLSIYKDEILAQQLQNLQMGESIPPELYNIVAEILVFIAQVDKKGLF